MLKDVIDGFTAYGSALVSIRQHRLWRYFFIPALISVVLFALIFGFIWLSSSSIGNWMLDIYPWDLGRSLVEKSASILGGILLASLGLILYKNTVMALAAPFMSLLSERIEKERYDDVEEIPWSIGRWFNETIRGIRIAIRSILREVCFTLCILLLGLIPFFAPFSATLIFLLQSYYAGFGSMDYTLERHLNVRDSVGFVRTHRGLAIGNGSVFILLLMTGIGFLIALPWSTIAATDEVLKRLE